MAENRPYTPYEKRMQDKATAAANRSNAASVGRAEAEEEASEFIRSKGKPVEDAEPDYTGMGMVERGEARKKWLKAREEREKKKAEQAAVRSMK